MFLSILHGYNAKTNEYTDSQGQIVNLPLPSFLVEDALSPDYDDFGTIENWYVYGKGLIGITKGYRDYMSWRAQISTLIYALAGEDFATWDNLSDAEKIIALRLLPTKIIDAKGFTFFATQVVTLISNGDMPLLILDNYLDDSAGARSFRYDALLKFAYQYMGKNQGLKAELILRATFTDSIYIERGVMYKSEDDQSGFGDWILSNVGTLFELDGLKARIISGEFVLGGGIDVDTFCAVLINIAENGVY